MQNPIDLGTRIMIVDDQMANIRLLEGVLQQMGQIEVLSITDSREVARQYAEFRPDLILLDLHMPHLDGFAVLEQLTPLIDPEAYLPILVLTADITTQAKRRALAGGAKDFLTKPFDPVEVTLRIRNLLETRALHMTLRNANQLLERRVRERTLDLEYAQLEVLERLALAAEYRDDDTGQHTQRVGRAAALLARALGQPEDKVAVLRRAAPLHDVGKIGISDLILLKPGRLTPEEFQVMKTHAEIGAQILAEGGFDLLRMAELIARSHHERWDGSGYPRGLAGEEIPLVGRIVAIVDAFDALTHDRPYKKAWPLAETLEEIRRQSGRQFDPSVVDVFLALAETTDLRDPPESV